MVKGISLFWKFNVGFSARQMLGVFTVLLKL